MDDKMYCKVWGALCNIDRSLHGPTGFAESMAKRGHWHDRFTCPHTGKPWHNKALELAQEISKSSSKRLAELMHLDIEDILRENGCR